MKQPQWQRRAVPQVPLTRRELQCQLSILCMLGSREGRKFALPMSQMSDGHCWRKDIGARHPDTPGGYVTLNTGLLSSASVERLFSLGGRDLHTTAITHDKRTL